jgi:mono/diheme cytochrome c family protein
MLKREGYMTEQQHSGAQSLSANAAAFILIFNFIVIAGILLAYTALDSPQASGETENVAAARGMLETVTLTAAPLLPTEAPAVEMRVTAGDPANGQVLFNTFQAAASFACATCHYVDREDQLIGPGLFNVSIRAESQVAGMSAYDYLHTSIVDPGAFVVPTFPDGLMPRNWADIYAEAEINDLIAYLMTLR